MSRRNSNGATGCFKSKSNSRRAKNVVVFRHDTPRLRERNGLEESPRSSFASGTQIHIDSSVQHIKPNAFANMKNIVEVVDMSKGRLESLGVMTFNGCLNLRTVHLKSTLLKGIPYGTFASCTRLVNVDLPTSILRLEESAFSYCASLKHIQVPPKVVQIQERAFRGCKQLETIGWPEMLFEISAGTFLWCKALVNVQLPSSVLSIQESAFAFCFSLTFLGLPNGLHSIGGRAFHGCRSLVTLALPPSLVEIQQTAFQSCSGLMSIEVCGDKMGKLEVGDCAFDGCTSLIHFAIPRSKLQLGNDVFQNCSLLQTEMLIGDSTPRFESLPMHGLCYHQGSFPLPNILDELSTIDPLEVAILMKEVDCLGMNPFHILALSSRPDKALFECFVKLSTDKEVLKQEDNLNGTPMDYLFRNPSIESVESISYLVNWFVNDQIERLALQRWRSELSGMRSMFLRLDKPEQTRDRFRALICKITVRERQEALSILECAVWKVKLINVAMKTKNTANGCVDRRLCRLSCGADEVILNVQPFLERVEVV